MSPRARHRKLDAFLDRREHILVVATIFVLQAIINGAYTLHSLLVGHVPTIEELPAEIAFYALACALWYLMFRAVALTFGRTFGLRAAVAVAVTSLSVALFAFALLQIRFVDAGLPGTPSLDMLAVTATWSSPIFVTWALVLMVLAYALDARERDRLLASANRLAQAAQLRALQYQINPHFLYNALNSISALILDRRNDHAEEMVMRLSDFLRLSLGADAAGEVTLEREIGLQSAYLAIERVRFEDQLRVGIDVPPELEAALVPSFILQPLVENVIKHGLGPFGTTTDLRVSARSQGERLVLKVENRGGEGQSVRKGSGIGLRNVRERLEARYGQQQLFEAGRGADGGFCARLELPLRFARSGTSGSP